MGFQVGPRKFMIYLNFNEGLKFHPKMIETVARMYIVRNLWRLQKCLVSWLPWL